MRRERSQAAKDDIARYLINCCHVVHMFGGNAARRTTLRIMVGHFSARYLLVVDSIVQNGFKTNHITF
jgi:hypothetical protein